MSEIEKMYENCGIKIPIARLKIFKDDNREIFTRPPFTAEKQLFLFQWVCKKFDEIYISYTNFEEVQSWEIVYKISVHRNSFEECLCAFVNLFWQDLTREEKQQVKGILE